ncbi:MAG: hypothetical protein DRI88_01450 [Bacteroidetes bacterium]|nr:MAG: hypothetical protein DRI72_02645 [Bacteroidota bacterium]RLD49078.1 MAG: hypothetical protein DRI88_01450 [Bacteroidota bacterium]RLD71120.1 MAG: hypothetical protein DRI87_07360 [Bacteroidota bacterium]RLD89109.1 MAG: hypothetical protein DRJ02_02220 [Bacteroidota bacterium]
MLSKGSFEDFLYILIGIIWVAFSIYKGSKRKKQTQKQSVKKDKGFFETLLEEVTKQDQQQVDIPYTQEIPLSETPLPPEERIFSYDDAYEEENYKEPEVILATDETQQKTDLKTQSQTAERKKLRFDLKKAIIYSEILQPKYF